MHVLTVNAEYKHNTPAPRTLPTSNKLTLSIGSVEHCKCECKKPHLYGFRRKICRWSDMEARNNRFKRLPSKSAEIWQAFWNSEEGYRPEQLDLSVYLARHPCTSRLRNLWRTRTTVQLCLGNWTVNRHIARSFSIYFPLRIIIDILCYSRHHANMHT